MAEDSGITITIEGESHKLDDFSLGDLEWLEEYLGTTLDDNQAMNSMKAAVGLVYLIKRESNPEFTLEDARKMKLNVFDQPAENGNGKAKRRPTKAADAA
jgi:hypothetical protein